MIQNYSTNQIQDHITPAKKAQTCSFFPIQKGFPVSLNHQQPSCSEGFAASSPPVATKPLPAAEPQKKGKAKNGANIHTTVGCSKD